MRYVNFKKLKDRVSLTDVLEHYGLIESLTETPQGYEGVCPICGDSAFKANTEKNAWFCFGECKEKEEKNGGNILDLVARKEGVSVKKAAGLIAEWFPENTEENVSIEQKDTGTTSEEGSVGGAGDDEGQGDALVPAEPETPVTAAPVKPVSRLKENTPLTFTLKGIDQEHPTVIDAGMSDVDAARYGVGYFSGKGMMHNRIVFPFHSEKGEVLGYAGYSPKDSSWKYPPPEKFNPGLEIFGLYQALHWNPPPGAVPLVALFRDPLIALVSAAIWPNLVPIAVVSPELGERQKHLLDQLLEDGSKIRFAVPYDDTACVDILSELLPHYYVRLVRY
jgi:hypothetical protein